MWRVFRYGFPSVCISLSRSRCTERVDGGDDPDITHGATIEASIRLLRRERTGVAEDKGILLLVGEGVGVVTKPGLPVAVGEPAINPVPRQMIVANVLHLLRCAPKRDQLPTVVDDGKCTAVCRSPSLFLPFPPGERTSWDVEVTLSIEEGEVRARRTLNPRLGIVGGLSVLGTTGLVKPFSHEAYEETIDYALRFALVNGCDTVVLSTGGKSEQYARSFLPHLAEAAFVQIADFFDFAVSKAFGRLFTRYSLGRRLRWPVAMPTPTHTTIVSRWKCSPLYSLSLLPLSRALSLRTRRCRYSPCVRKPKLTTSSMRLPVELSWSQQSALLGWATVVSSSLTTTDHSSVMRDSRCETLSRCGNEANVSVIEHRNAV